MTTASQVSCVKLDIFLSLPKEEMNDERTRYFHYLTLDFLQLFPFDLDHELHESYELVEVTTCFMLLS